MGKWSQQAIDDYALRSEIRLDCAVEAVKDFVDDKMPINGDMYYWASIAQMVMVKIQTARVKVTGRGQSYRYEMPADSRGNRPKPPDARYILNNTKAIRFKLAKEFGIYIVPDGRNGMKHVNIKDYKASLESRQRRCSEGFAESYNEQQENLPIGEDKRQLVVEQKLLQRPKRSIFSRRRKG